MGFFFENLVDFCLKIRNKRKSLGFHPIVANSGPELSNLRIILNRSTKSILFFIKIVVVFFIVFIGSHQTLVINLIMIYYYHTIKLIISFNVNNLATIARKKLKFHSLNSKRKNTSTKKIEQ